MDLNPQVWFQSLPVITQSWFGASLIVNIATTIDVLSVDDLIFHWPCIYNKLELWRIGTSFLYAGGSMHEFHVLILLYLIPLHSTGYEKNPYPTGGTPRADYAFCMFFCVVLIMVSYLLIDYYENSIVSTFYSLIGGSISSSSSSGNSNNVKRFRKTQHNPLLYPLFTRTLVTSVMYLWSRRNPNVNIQLNFIPVRGQYLPFAHLGLALLMGNRINELLHGIFVGHVYYYLVEVVPVITGRYVLTTPTSFVYLLSSGSGEEGQQGDYRVVHRNHHAVNNHRGAMDLAMRAYREDGASRAHIAAKLGNLEELQRLSATPEGRVAMGANDRNDWQPLHEAVRGGYQDVVQFLLEFDDVVNVNARTQGGLGPSPRWIAETTHGPDHPVSRYLQTVGAVSSGPAQE